ncbi:pleckstrin homology domain-containing family A member 8-like isoform X2 [Ptychodera flava]|uniref:pleckstrin homology domain-containing family A member 8-like isoform X2 n=1 Tax=Ptychodera flava TaxID=63121 RepID=UPI00396A438B
MDLEWMLQRWKTLLLAFGIMVFSVFVLWETTHVRAPHNHAKDTQYSASVIRFDQHNNVGKQGLTGKAGDGQLPDEKRLEYGKNEKTHLEADRKISKVANDNSEQLIQKDSERTGDADRNENLNAIQEQVDKEKAAGEIPGEVDGIPGEQGEWKEGEQPRRKVASLMDNIKKSINDRKPFKLDNGVHKGEEDSIGDDTDVAEEREEFHMEENNDGDPNGDTEPRGEDAQGIDAREDVNEVKGEDEENKDQDANDVREEAEKDEDVVDQNEIVQKEETDGDKKAEDIIGDKDDAREDAEEDAEDEKEEIQEEETDGDKKAEDVVKDGDENVNDDDDLSKIPGVVKVDENGNVPNANWNPKPRREKFANFFSDQPVSFSDVTLVRDEELGIDDGIPLEPFITACYGFLPMIDYFGSTFSKAKSDLEKNINRIRTRYNENPERYTILQTLVAAEFDMKESNQLATKGVRWIKRSMEFTKELLKNIEAGMELSEAANVAYDDTLIQYHNWFIQKIFKLGFQTLGSRDELLRKIARNPEDVDNPEFEPVLAKDMDQYLDDLQKTLDIIKKFFDKYDIEN